MRANQRGRFSDVQTSNIISCILNGSRGSLCKETSKRQKWSILAELQRAKRASGAPWVRKISKPRKFGYNITVRMSFVRTNSWEWVGASQYKPISYAIESCQHSHSIFRFPFPPSISFRKHYKQTKKKKTFWIYIAYCDFSSVLN